ncbi:MAG: bifunctional 5,10-methylenetetrahydrofolate dehydrogenase/5,10-methenyltetrahydrofolate cyclohydrolase [Elusimicrobia bacterium]|nr:bifunctional 5,10-methylenetetrahydrofolate dehydrogenase/5,10-methenyltetrahydrofolate cyclohydrolase [Elusimicrobiota bacterium]MDE2237214.1 bifunctional 5,10-methylenetetrahydrofolate dehydrogenase/5,10-methenyltetrahydrofolate cyclohydrolase [Elusimicrobiota bacterium]MDE2424556.1 bifunctional 5,10-methylenetetrahydrofolate dehydrogenase/5,10-methenyltetrahydrofolate cyclohydrolase [Elusimicrobiota bacterium]
MSARLLDGRALAAQIVAGLKPRIEALKKTRGRAPGLLIIASDLGERPAKAYRRAQLAACTAAGIHARLEESRWADASAVLAVVEGAADCDGVILDLPLPGGVDAEELLRRLPAGRDAEGVTPANYGRLFQSKSFNDIAKRRLTAPCTALAIAELAISSGTPLSGKTAVVLGRSGIVGRPAAHLLSCLDATVTLCHSKTPALDRIAAAADIVVAAVGRPGLVKPGWIKPGAVVIDAGVNAVDGRLVGDVDPACAERAGWLTPVPGGVGPVTNAMLLANTVALAEARQGLRRDS